MRRLPDGNWLLRLDGVEVQTLTLEQKREILKMQVELEGLQKEAALLRAQVRDYELIRELFGKQQANSDKQIEGLKASIAILEKQLKEQSELLKLAVAQTKRNRVEQWLSNPVASLAFKLAVPLGNLILTRVR